MGQNRFVHAYTFAVRSTVIYKPYYTTFLSRLDGTTELERGEQLFKVLTCGTYHETGVYLHSSVELNETSRDY